MATYEERIDRVITPALKQGVFVYANYGELRPGPGLSEGAFPKKPAGLPDWQIYQETVDESGAPTVFRYLQISHHARRPTGPEWQTFRSKGPATHGYNLIVPLGIGAATPENEKFLVRDLLAKIMLKPVYAIGLGRYRLPRPNSQVSETDCILMEVYAHDGSLLWVNPFCPPLEDVIRSLASHPVDVTMPHLNAPVAAGEPDVIPYMVPRSGPIEPSPASTVEIASLHERLFRNSIRNGLPQEEIIRVACTATGYTHAVIQRALENFKVRLRVEEMFDSLDKLKESLREDQITHRIAASLKLKEETVKRYFDDYMTRREVLETEKLRAQVLPVADMARILGLEGNDMLQAVVEDSGIAHDKVLEILQAEGYVSGPLPVASPSPAIGPASLGTTLSLQFDASELQPPPPEAMPRSESRHRIHEGTHAPEEAPTGDAHLAAYSRPAGGNLEDPVAIHVYDPRGEEPAVAARVPAHSPALVHEADSDEDGHEERPKRRSKKAKRKKAGPEATAGTIIVLPTKPGPKPQKKRVSAPRPADESADSVIVMDDLIERRQEFQDKAVAFLRKTGERHYAGEIRDFLGMPSGSSNAMRAICDFMRRHILMPLVESQAIIREAGHSSRSTTYRINR